MELKDMILSTLAELEDVKEETQEEPKEDITTKSSEATPLIKEISNEQEDTQESIPTEISSNESFLDEERQFYENIRERILVLFEGFQSPTNKSIEAKVDLTLNFLEYLLATIDERLEKLDNR
jgi:hypothetical protein